MRRGSSTMAQRCSEARCPNIPPTCSSTHSLFMRSLGPPSLQLGPISNISSSSPLPAPVRVGQSSVAQHSSPLFCFFSLSLRMGLVRSPYCSPDTPYQPNCFVYSFTCTACAPSQKLIKFD